MKSIVRRGRPSKYSPKLAYEILRRLSLGESILTICKDDGMPNSSTFYNWLLLDKTGVFSNDYNKARAMQASKMFDDLLVLSDLSSSEIVGGKDTGDNARVQARRLQVDTRKWYLSKVLPKLYGDKLDLTSGGEKLPTPILQLTSVVQKIHEMPPIVETPKLENGSVEPLPDHN